MAYRNAKSQLSTALHQSGIHQRGFDKHTAKAEGMDRRDMPITGDETWGKVKGMAKDFGDFVKAEYRDVRDMADLPKEAYRDFVQSKLDSGCKDSTCQAYISRLDRVEQARSIHTDTPRHDLSDLRAMSHEQGDRDLQDATRAFRDPQNVIEHIEDPQARAFASLQYGLGARFNGIQGLTRENFGEVRTDPATGREMGTVTLPGKGKEYENRYVPAEVFNRAKAYVETVGRVEIRENYYRDQIKDACRLTGEHYSGSHAFRHSAAQDSVAYWTPIVGHSAAKAFASETLGHHRPEITDTYLR